MTLRFVCSKQLLLFWLGCCQVSSVVAIADPMMLQLQELRQTCLRSDQQCLQNTLELLTQQNRGSRLWYELQLQQLDILFRTQQDNELLALTTELMQETDLPALFRGRLAIYHAKMLHYHQADKAHDYYLQAKQFLGNWQDSNGGDLQSYIRLYNLELYFNENRTYAYEQLLRMAEKYAQRQDPMMQYELYNNLGHFASKANDLENALRHRQDALRWALQTNHIGVKAQAHFNLARQYSYLAKWQACEQLFKSAYLYYQEAGDPIASAESLMFGAEALWHIGAKEQARAQLQSVSRQHLPKYRLEALHRIEQLIAADLPQTEQSTPN